MVLSPENEKADRDRALKMDGPWPAMRSNKGMGEGAARGATSGQLGSRTGAARSPGGLDDHLSFLLLLKAEEN